MPKVNVLPDNAVYDVKEGQNLLKVLLEQKVRIRSSCGGHGSCSDCVIKITSGKEHLSEITFEEKQLLGNVFFITKERLACQTKISGDIEIDISAHKED